MGLLSFIQDLYENIRPTKSTVKSEKRLERNYDFKNGEGFTGDRKKDMEFVKHLNVDKQKRDNTKIQEKDTLEK